MNEPDTLHIQLAETGHMRRFSKLPFDGGVEYTRHTRVGFLLREAIMHIETARHALRDSYTINGDWDTADQEVRDEYMAMGDWLNDARKLLGDDDE